LQTLPSIVAREKLEKRSRTPSDELDGPQITEESQLLRPEGYPRYGIDHTSESPASTENGSSNSGYRAILTRPLLMTLTNHVFLTFLDMCHFVLLPLMYSTSIPLGGLGLDPFHIGVTLGTFGCINSLIQMNFLGRLIRKFGARRVYIFASPALASCFAMYPIMSFFARRAGGVDAIVITCMVVQLTCHMAIYMAYGMFSSLGTSTPTNILFFCGTGSLQVILVENVPENGPMGTLNGIAQMLGSGMRSIAPTFASSLFSISLQRGLAGGNMVYYILLAMTFVSSRLSLMLPKHVKAKRRST
jgi:MFS family permease